MQRYVFLNILAHMYIPYTYVYVSEVIMPDQLFSFFADTDILCSLLCGTQRTIITPIFLLTCIYIVFYFLVADYESLIILHQIK